MGTKANFAIFDTEPTQAKVTKSQAKQIAKKVMAEQFSLFDCDPLSLPASEISTPFALGNRVPNEFPTTNLPYKIAIIGEAPGEDEERLGKPFVGHSGRFLDQVLSKTGISRAACFIGNVCQYRPPKNDLSQFTLTGDEITSGLCQLREDLVRFKPNVCLLLGKTSLWAASGSFKIGDYRGSLFNSDRLLACADNQFEPPIVKCIATYHPAYCLRQYEWTPLVMLDVRKAMAEATFPELVLPKRELITNLSASELCHELDSLDSNLASLDIEGGVASMPCISVATSPNRSVLIPFATIDGGNYWQNEEDEFQVYKRLVRVLGDRRIPKVWQNGLYDRFVLQWSQSIVVRGNKDDTMLKWWELYCELEKNLGFLCSVATREPFYKFERKSDNQKVFFEYCCKDSAVTYEVNKWIEPKLDAGQMQHYRFNHDLLNPLLYMELRGIRYNEPLAKQRLTEMKDHVYGFQDKLDSIAREMGVLDSIDFSKPRPEILAQVQDRCCYVRDKTQPKAWALEAGYWNTVSILKDPIGGELSSEERGRISMLCKTTMNTKSKKFKDFLYDECELPTQWKKDPSTKEMRVTTDYEALLKLSKSHTHAALNIALELSRLRTRAQMLAILPIKGRMHCNYNLVGSETGRVTCSKSNLFVQDGRVGANMQTVPDDWDLEDESNPLTQGMRDLMLADEGCYLAKCDLKGADGWTVGSYMAMLGDPTMLDDLKFGLKPAQIVAYILKHGAGPTLGKTRYELKEMVKEIKKEDWEYFVSKQGIWGTCYTMGPRKLAERVFIESEGKVNLSEKEARDFQSAIFVRYRVKLWHTWMQRFCDSQSYPAKLTASNGFTRKFFGRKTEILGEALAHLPQVYTTYATNTAAHKLWFDPDNRIRISDTSCRLRVEPLHQVHDELLVQFKIEDTSWAIDKLKSWFNNPVIIANQKIVIPFDGAYGTNWSMDEQAKVGEIK